MRGLGWVVLLVAGGCDVGERQRPRNAHGPMFERGTTVRPRRGVEVKVNHRPYTIVGASHRALQRDINKKQVKAPGGGMHAAKCEWHVSWRYSFDTSGGGCRMASVKAKVVVDYVMPHWPDQSGASPKLRRRWRTFIDNLFEHERGHGNHGVSAANEVQRKLMMLRADSCSELDRRAATASEQILDKYRLKDARYDEQTDHGKTQGATL